RADVGATRLDAPGSALHLALPHDAAEARIRDVVQSWLQGEAARIFAERIERFGDRIGPKFAGWRLSSARSQWGSCTHDGRVRLNWRLVHFSLPVIDYVVAHELAHLQELNHSPRFWRAVEQLLPGFETARDEIKGVDMRSLPL
ncbi:MAG TPA: SprT family zinc-dependent metalloprotease, partial [Burkholderiaceae bacterium]|nr:SprT family zinc-dependent metalloprotease [Burkholderiaceae bacterium]